MRIYKYSMGFRIPVWTHSIYYNYDLKSFRKFNVQSIDGRGPVGMYLYASIKSLHALPGTSL